MLEGKYQSPQNFEQNQNDNDFGPSIQPKKELNRGQKIAAISLAVFALIIIIFWSLQFHSILYGPSSGSRISTNSTALTEDEIDAKKQQELMTADTDKDGLSDWDELNTYKTSPYLEDSDGDDYSDKEEVGNDKDPNCPLNRDCYGLGIVDGDENLVTDKTTEQTGTDAAAQQQATGQSTQNNSNASSMSDDEMLQKILSGEMDASTLRQILMSQGMSKEQLDNISDEQLMKNYQDTLNSAPAE